MTATIPPAFISFFFVLLIRAWVLWEERGTEGCLRRIVVKMNSNLFFCYELMGRAGIWADAIHHLDI